MPVVRSTLAARSGRRVGHHPQIGGPRLGQQRALQIGHVAFGNGQERPRRPQAKAVERGPGRYVADYDGEAQPLDERCVEGVLVALDGHAADTRLRQRLDNRGACGADATHDDAALARGTGPGP